jgi:ribosomal protein L7/L12
MTTPVKRPGTKPDHSAKGVAPEATSDSTRLVIQSIGTASFSIIAALRQVSTLTEQELAERLFRAPAELFAGVPRPTAEKAAEVLRGAGLEVDVLANEAPFTPGDKTHDIALLPTDFSRMPEVVREVIHLLGVDARTARQMVCTSPTILVGAVSSATVEAIRRRFAPLGVELAVSRPAESSYDVVVGPCAPSVRARLLETLEGAGVPVLRPAGGGMHDTPLVAAGLDKAAAQRIWNELGRKNPALRILDRAFERFDVRLDACPLDAVKELVTVTGMPEKVALKVLERLPVIVQQNLTYEEARESLAKLAALGATAVDELRTLQTFSMVVETAPDRPKAAQRIRALLDLKADEADALLRGLPNRIEGPLSLPLARWLQAELKAAGATTKLVRR